MNRSVFAALYTEKAREVVGSAQTDVQFIIEFRDADFDVRLSGGPIHKNEVGRYLKFESKEFEKAGFFVDIDFYRTTNLKHDEVPRLLRNAVELTWTKAENLAIAVGV